MATSEQMPTADAGPVERVVRPAVWVRRNGEFTSGVAHYGAECPFGWTLAAEPMYDRAALAAAVAAERGRIVRRGTEYAANMLQGEGDKAPALRGFLLAIEAGA